MKKLLSILASAKISALSVITVVACAPSFGGDAPVKEFDKEKFGEAVKWITNEIKLFLANELQYSLSNNYDLNLLQEKLDAAVDVPVSYWK
ncbi:hypothetical protein NPX79_02445 [Spiroplasma endosymbiont of Anurida maritima]|uniref:hypothetical protein n=1 Tax=Spiroplasma endosymbiont of Anurida maritima TaxID=2967972 RepID=UPI0036D3F41D